VLVDALPRRATGKLREALVALEHQVKRLR
jgi:hypothetical protein